MPTPRYATQLERFSIEVRIAADAMRLRVGVAANVPSGERNVRISDIAHSVVIGALNLGRLKTGAVRVKACEKIKPYVHIVYVNTMEKGIQYAIPHSISTVGHGNGPYLSLQRIDAFTSSPSLPCPLSVAVNHG